jgi:DNA/RNA-binding domain of Phe-tRNA-synthetase-like protein
VLEEFLAGGQVGGTVFALRPDYRAMLLAVDGIVPGPGDEASDALLRAAEAAATEALRDQPPEQLPHVAAWREAYRAFGAKPQRTRPSVDALLRRADELPAINRVVDAYNAVSVEYALPVGGEDLDAYQGPARLIRATGSETFDLASGTEHPNPGEVVWRDDLGVTCRRWNWRQCVRTRLTESTKNALFLLERLEPYPLERLDAAGEDLAARLRVLAPDVRLESRLITAS